MLGMSLHTFNWLGGTCSRVGGGVPRRVPEATGLDLIDCDFESPCVVISGASCSRALWSVLWLPEQELAVALFSFHCIYEAFKDTARLLLRQYVADAHRATVNCQNDAQSWTGPKSCCWCCDLNFEGVARQSNHISVSAMRQVRIGAGAVGLQNIDLPSVREYHEAAGGCAEL